MELMRLPPSVDNQAAVAEWFADLTEIDSRQLLSQLHLELRMGCGISQHYHGFAPFSLMLSPYSSRAVQATLLRLPATRQYDLRFSRFQGLVVKHAWPELETLPYQRQPGAVGYARYVASQRLRRAPPLRKKFASIFGKRRERTA